MGVSVLPSCDECEDGADDGASGGERERPAEPCAGRRSEREYRADYRFRSHDVPWHNRRYGVPAPKSGRNLFSLFLFGFRLISLMSPVTALMGAARLATRSEMLVIISDGVMLTSFPDITIIL